MQNVTYHIQRHKHFLRSFTLNSTKYRYSSSFSLRLAFSFFINVHKMRSKVRKNFLPCHGRNYGIMGTLSNSIQHCASLLTCGYRLMAQRLCLCPSSPLSIPSIRPTVRACSNAPLLRFHYRSCGYVNIYTHSTIQSYVRIPHQQHMRHRTARTHRHKTGAPVRPGRSSRFCCVPVCVGCCVCVYT